MHALLGAPVNLYYKIVAQILLLSAGKIPRRSDRFFAHLLISSNSVKTLNKLVKSKEQAALLIDNEYLRRRTRSNDHRFQELELTMTITGLLPDNSLKTFEIRNFTKKLTSTDGKYFEQGLNQIAYIRYGIVLSLTLPAPKGGQR
ncbi:hypothetical protein A6770_40060 [Nostoc minutum NIES-26]|uniref:Uncharacterized protein n=1 Tax=Nostoc minutum NIES-26 TaxID=1844469 RepID=A0A367RMQ9_9NOSO|nr:hypothetical protein A6770_40060 [Nostoc minutum NIES-26]